MARVRATRMQVSSGVQFTETEVLRRPHDLSRHTEKSGFIREIRDHSARPIAMSVTHMNSRTFALLRMTECLTRGHTARYAPDRKTHVDSRGRMGTTTDISHHPRHRDRFVQAIAVFKFLKTILFLLAALGALGLMQQGVADEA